MSEHEGSTGVSEKELAEAIEEVRRKGDYLISLERLEPRTLEVGEGMKFIAGLLQVGQASVSRQLTEIEWGGGRYRVRLQCPDACDKILEFTIDGEPRDRNPLPFYAIPQIPTPGDDGEPYGEHTVGGTQIPPGGRLHSTPEGAAAARTMSGIFGNCMPFQPDLIGANPLEELGKAIIQAAPLIASAVASRGRVARDDEKASGPPPEPPVTFSVPRAWVREQALEQARGGHRGLDRRLPLGMGLGAFFQAYAVGAFLQDVGVAFDSMLHRHKDPGPGPIAVPVPPPWGPRPHPAPPEDAEGAPASSLDPQGLLRPLTESPVGATSEPEGLSLARQALYEALARQQVERLEGAATADERCAISREYMGLDVDRLFEDFVVLASPILRTLMEHPPKGPDLLSPAERQEIKSRFEEAGRQTGRERIDFGSIFDHFEQLFKGFFPESVMVDGANSQRGDVPAKDDSGEDISGSNS